MEKIVRHKPWEKLFPTDQVGLSRGNHSVLIDRLIGDDSRTLLKTKIDFFVCPPRNQGLEIVVVVVVEVGSSSSVVVASSSSSSSSSGGEFFIFYS